MCWKSVSRRARTIRALCLNRSDLPCMRRLPPSRRQSASGAKSLTSGSSECPGGGMRTAFKAGRSQAPSSMNRGHPIPARKALRRQTLRTEQRNRRLVQVRPQARPYVHGRWPRRYSRLPLLRLVRQRQARLLAGRRLVRRSCDGERAGPHPLAGDGARPGIRSNDERRRPDAGMGPTARFRENLCRRAMIDDGFAEDQARRPPPRSNSRQRCGLMRTDQR